MPNDTSPMATPATRVLAASSLPRSAWFLLAAVTLGWGFNWPIMKVVLAEVPPWTFRTLCLAASAACLLTVARLNGHTLRVPARAWPALVAVALSNVTAWSLFSVYGIKYLPAGRAAILAYTMPAWTILLGWWLLKERITARKLLGLACGLAGMLILMGSEIRALRAAPIGALCMFGAALAWALGTVLFKRYPIPVSTVAVTGWMMALGGIPIWIATPFLEHDALRWYGLGATLGLLYNMLIAFNFCYWAWQKIVTLAPAGVSALSTLMIPVIGVLSSMWILGERPGWQEFSALALVLGALATVLLPSGGRTQQSS
jgi:drug/metabolite transporter (DMT)-like permease